MFSSLFIMHYHALLLLMSLLLSLSLALSFTLLLLLLLSSLLSLLLLLLYLLSLFLLFYHYQCFHHHDYYNYLKLNITIASENVLEYPPYHRTWTYHYDIDRAELIMCHMYLGKLILQLVLALITQTSNTCMFSIVWGENLVQSISWHLVYVTHFHVHWHYGFLCSDNFLCNIRWGNTWTLDRCNQLSFSATMFHNLHHRRPSTHCQIVEWYIACLCAISFWN